MDLHQGTMKRILLASFFLICAAFCGYSVVASIEIRDSVSQILRQGFYGCLGVLCVLIGVYQVISVFSIPRRSLRNAAHKAGAKNENASHPPFRPASAV